MRREPDVVYEVDDLQITGSAPGGLPDDAHTLEHALTGPPGRPHRPALVLGFVLALATPGAFAGWVLVDVVPRALHQVEADLQRDLAVHGALARLGADDRVREVNTLAAGPLLAAALAGAPGADRQRAAFEVVEAQNAALARAGRKADIVLLLDPQGRVVARDGDQGALIGEDLMTVYPSLRSVLGGKPAADLWQFTHAPLVVAAAPIAGPAGTPVGLLVVGRVLVTADATMLHDVLGVDVALADGGHLLASSLPGDDGRDGRHAVEVALFGGAHSVHDSRAPGGRAVDLELGGQPFLAAAAPLAGAYANQEAEVILLAPLWPAREPGLRLLAGAVALAAAGLALMLLLAFGLRARAGGLGRFLRVHPVVATFTMLFAVAAPLGAPRLVSAWPVAQARMARPAAAPAPSALERMADVVAACEGHSLAGRTARLPMSRIARVSSSADGKAVEFPAWVGGCAVGDAGSRQTVIVSVANTETAGVEGAFPTAEEASARGVSACRTIDLRFAEACSPLRADLTGAMSVQPVPALTPVP